jgi:tRNA/rRNA methyltransferase
MEFYFIIVEPKVQENIGASARAIKTMGFSTLRLVNPGIYLSDKARIIAHGSEDILEKTQLFGSLSEAIADIDFTIGTTAIKRSVKHDYYSVMEINSIIKNKRRSIHKAGILFGREESGLTNNELKLCDLVSTIPMKIKYPSINLAQAVMIYAYTLSEFTIKKIPFKYPIKDLNSFIELKKKVVLILKSINIQKDTVKFNRIMERINILGDDDIHLMHSVCNEIIKLPRVQN